MKEKQKRYINSIFFVTIATLMVALSNISKSEEIIFPEIAALAIGSFLSPSFSWKVSKTNMVILISLCSVIGLTISLFIHIPMVFKIIIAYIICQILMLLFKTTFAPMISAAILPILMETTSIVYPISAIVFTILIALIRKVLEKNQFKEKIIETKKELGFRDYFDLFTRTVLIFIYALLVLNFDLKFCVAPPLIVAFTEISRENHPMQKQPIKYISAISICAFIGAYLRFFLCVKLGINMILVAFLISCAVAILIYSFNSFIPPAGALAFLPMIIPEKQLLIYPFEILVSISIFMLISIIYNKILKREKISQIK